MHGAPGSALGAVAEDSAVDDLLEFKVTVRNPAEDL